MMPVRFIPGPSQDDQEFVVLGVELHPTIVVIDIATTQIPKDRHLKVRRETPLPEVTVTDDLDTVYEGRPLSRYGSGWSGNAPVRRFPMEFKPAVPKGATSLRITLRISYGEFRSVVVSL